ncbi:ATPase [Deinococcus navajonensis]|uniref:ATPase n=1 Tax=Deinococcus navajonensis TaxID=309884 RepID=A0ABV8XRW6_9DEIO
MSEPSLLPFLRATPEPSGPWVPLANLPLTVLVGVTGVGKSTALRALQEATPDIRVLPDRREVTDAVMLWPLAGGPVTDREHRFRLTAEYRLAHPGGMAQALGTLQADTRHWGQGPIFDGLRGLDEVKHAAQHFPAWRFVALGAPDAVRVRRLLGRADSFDRIQGSGGSGAQNLRTSLGALPGAEAVFGPAELDALADLASEGHSPDEILAKTRIVLSERRQYDPQAAEAYLRTFPPARALVLDTVALGPAEVAQAVRGWVLGDRA